MLSLTTTAVIRRQVAWRFDCEPDDLRSSPPLVKAHGPHFVGYYGIYVWLMDDLTAILAPMEWVPIVQQAIAGQTSAALGDTDFWRAVLGEYIERIVGPSYQGYVDTGAFQPAPSLSRGPSGSLVPILDPENQSALKDLAAACSPQEWRDSAIHPNHSPIFVLEQSGAFVAAASAPEDGPGVVSIGVITHPSWRGRGYGTAVVSALTADRLAAGAVVHYQTLQSNLASVSVARSLGYHDLATALSVRLRR